MTNKLLCQDLQKFNMNNITQMRRPYALWITRDIGLCTLSVLIGQKFKKVLQFLKDLYVTCREKQNIQSIFGREKIKVTWMFIVYKSR